MIGFETSPGRSFVVGICATGARNDLGGLLKNILSDAKSVNLQLRKLIVVASECPQSTIDEVEQCKGTDERVQLLVEETRLGKSEAINKILARADGDFLILVNSDARPEPGSIANLLGVVDSDPAVGAATAMPTIKTSDGLTSMLTDFIWTTHNECSLVLNHMNLANHSSDELVVFRSSAVGLLPPGLVNDGAYMAAMVKRRGLSIRFCSSARVTIKTPTRVSDLISQRRRILFGHVQVWRATGHPPKTIETLLLFSSSIGIKLLVGIIAKGPRFLFVLPLAFVAELVASLLAINDSVRSSTRHTIWRRFS